MRTLKLSCLLLKIGELALYCLSHESNQKLKFEKRKKQVFRQINDGANCLFYLIFS